MDWAYSIELPANQDSVAVSDVEVMMAKTLHPEDWELWQGRENLFDRILFRVRHKVSLEFSGETAAAKEVIAALKSWDDAKLMESASRLSVNQLYHIYLAAVHSRLIFRSIANGEVERIEYNPTGTVAFDPLAEAAEMVVKSSDRIMVRELANYLKRFHIGLKRKSDESGVGVVAPLGPKKQAEGVNEVRGRLILKHLESLGYDPSKLEYENGKPSAKCEVRELIWGLQLQEFIHRTKGPDRAAFDGFFKKAWEWLSENNYLDNQKN